MVQREALTFVTMNTKLFPIALLTLALAGTAAQAQDAVKPTQDPTVQQQRSTQRAALMEQRSERTAQQLGLNAEQSTKMKEIDQRYMEAIEMVRNSTTDRGEIKMKNDILRRQHEAELEFMLTPEQFAKLKELRQGDRQQAVERSNELQERRMQE